MRLVTVATTVATAITIATATTATTVSASAAATTTVAAAATTTTATLARFVDSQDAAVQLRVVHGSDGRFGISITAHFDEGEAARSSSFAIGDDRDIGDLTPILLESFAKTLLCRLVRQVPHVQSVAHLTLTRNKARCATSPATIRDELSGAIVQDQFYATVRHASSEWRDLLALRGSGADWRCRSNLNPSRIPSSLNRAFTGAKANRVAWLILILAVSGMPLRPVRDSWR